jgi:subtilisin-like proprotein convertase family protein
MAATLGVLAIPAGATVFSNPTAIAIPAAPETFGPANPYPSTISVSGLTGTIVDVNVTLNNLSHTCTGDIDVLLVGPGGQKVQS